MPDRIDVPSPFGLSLSVPSPFGLSLSKPGRNPCVRAVLPFDKLRANGMGALALVRVRRQRLNETILRTSPRARQLLDRSPIAPRKRLLLRP